MNYVTGYVSSVGISKLVNQDSVCIRQARCHENNILMAVVCDGMGGMQEGEVASSTVVHAFYDWFEKRLPDIMNDYSEERVVSDWKRMIVTINQQMCEYGIKNDIQLGTTLSVILIQGDGNYVIGHVGDSRIYEIREGVRMLTQDQSLVADEARRGIISWQEAKDDPRRNILLECIGVSEEINPMFTSGRLLKKRSYVLLCSDGFCHELSDKELSKNLGKQFTNSNDITKTLKNLEWLCEKRGEHDNITAALVCCYES